MSPPVFKSRASPSSVKSISPFYDTKEEIWVLIRCRGRDTWFTSSKTEKDNRQLDCVQSRSKTLCGSDELRGCASARAGAARGWQHSKSSIGLLVNADVVRENAQKIESRFDPSEDTFRRGKKLNITEPSCEMLARFCNDPDHVSYRYSQPQHHTGGQADLSEAPERPQQGT